MTTQPEATPQTVYVKREACRGCQSPALASVLDLGTMHLPRFVDAIDETLPQAPLDLVRCAYCGLMQLQHTVAPDLLYREFHYRSGINDSMKNALADLVHSASRFHKRGSWLDIGANDGYLLSRVNQDFRKVACEPALNFRGELEELSDRVVSDYFSEGTVGEKFDVITSAACFYDVDSPADFVRDVCRSLNKGGVWINQLSDAPTMMKTNAFDAICHEHVAYYDIHTLEYLYRQQGMSIVGLTFNDVNGGSMRVFSQRTEDVKLDHRSLLMGVPRVEHADALAFAARVRRWKEVFGEMVHDLGPGLWCYGASTKGITLLHYLDLHPMFEAVADRNPRKHGKRLVGSWLPIVGEEEFRKARPRFAMVAPWAFRAEFDAREAEARANGTTFVYPLPNPTLVL